MLKSLNGSNLPALPTTAHFSLMRWFLSSERFYEADILRWWNLPYSGISNIIQAGALDRDSSLVTCVEEGSETLLLNPSWLVRTTQVLLPSSVGMNTGLPLNHICTTFFCSYLSDTEISQAFLCKVGSLPGWSFAFLHFASEKTCL